MLALFWICTALVLYTYVLYPCVIWILAKVAPARSSPASYTSTPTISIIVAVHNERDRIERKLTNLEQVDYPRELTQRVFASDGSTDGTNEILRAHADVVLVECPRGGKATAINAAVARATGAILVFTDARQELAADSATHLVRALADPRVGAVSGELTHRDATTGAARSIGIYWRYERFIRTHESTFFSCVGASGALYAMRRTDFEPLSPGTILDDFEGPMVTVRRRRRIVLESKARVFDDLEPELAGERKRKVRTLAGNFQSFARNRWLFSPRQNPVWWQFLSHKVGRLVVPYALIGALCSAWLLPGPMYRLFALGQTGFYLVAVAALASATVRHSKLASAAALFLDTNVAAIEALWLFIRGDLTRVWVNDTRQSPLE